MTYMKPSITGSFPALSVIQRAKGPQSTEMVTGNFTTGPAYQADE